MFKTEIKKEVPESTSSKSEVIKRKLFEGLVDHFG